VLPGGGRKINASFHVGKKRTGSRLKGLDREKGNGYPLLRKGEGASGGKETHLITEPKF